MRYRAKPLPYGIQNPATWWGSPISPSHPLRQTYNQIPWGAMSPLWVTAQHRVRCGRGMIVNVPFTPANTPVTVTHALGRIPQCLIVLSDAYTFPPRVAFAPGVRTSQQVSLQFDQAVNQQHVWIL
jgi:hypothetical protein